MIPQIDDLAASLQTEVHSLDELDPTESVELFDETEEPFRSVSVIGMGECTHRTREFVQLKHHLARHLATTYGLQWIGLEAPPVETAALHRCLVSGTGDIEPILSDIGFTIYQTAEMVSFLEWIQSYNKNRPRSECIGVFGFDVQSVDGPAKGLVDWLEGQEPDKPSVSASLSALIGEVYDGGNINIEVVERAERLLPELRDVVGTTRDTNATNDAPGTEQTDKTSQRGPRHPLATGASDRRTGRYLLRAFEQAVEFARLFHESDEPVSYGRRDKLMAANIAWVIDDSQPDRMAVWAHDNHVKTGSLSGDGHPSKTMGEHLRARLGEQYYALGFQFVRGTVRGFVPAADGDIEIDGETLKKDVVAVPGPIAGSIPDVLGSVDGSHGTLNLRAVSESNPAWEWLRSPRLHHYITGRIEPEDRRAFYRKHKTGAVFDGLGFVAEGTPTTPL